MDVKNAAIKLRVHVSILWLSSGGLAKLSVLQQRQSLIGDKQQGLKIHTLKASQSISAP